MKIDWSDIEYFLAVAQAKSIAAAAKQLKVNHSTVLRRIEKMEKSLGFSLFVKAKGSCLLTEEGSSVLVTAKRMSEHAHELLGQLNSDINLKMTGSVTISAADFVIAGLIAPSLAKFNAENPGIEISCLSSSEFVDLSERTADILVRLTDKPKYHLPKGLHGKKAGDVMLSAYKGTAYADKDLKWLSWDEAVNFDRWTSEVQLTSITEKLGVMNSCLTQAAAIKTGPFAAILPCFIADHDPALARVKGAKVFQGFEAWILTHPDLKDIKRIAASTQHLARVIKEALANKITA